MMNNAQPVYSTEFGQMCPGCGNPIANCICQEETAPALTDSIIRVRREMKGRAGKTVTTITGVPLAPAGLQELATELKRRLGTGGSVKDGIIIIQGDHRDGVIAALEKKGYKTKKAGG